MERIFEEVAADMRRLTHPHLFRHHDAPQPAAAPSPAIIATDTPEVTPMSLNLTAVEEHVKAAFDAFQAVDREALNALERVQANPDTAAAFALLDAVTKLPVGPGVLTTAIEVLKLTLGQAGTQPAATAEPAFTPQAAGPVIAGQA